MYTFARRTERKTGGNYSAVQVQAAQEECGTECGVRTWWNAEVRPMSVQLNGHSCAMQCCKIRLPSRSNTGGKVVILTGRYCDHSTHLSKRDAFV